MADEVTIALIAGVASIVGGLIGAVGSPVGKDWVGRREHERRTAAEKEANSERLLAESAVRDHDDERRASEVKAALVREIIDHMQGAQTNYEKEWRGQARSEEGAPMVIQEATSAWTLTRQLADMDAKEKIDAWRRALIAADMRYRNGAEPPGLEQVRQSFNEATDAVARLA